jgi:hypothetical protein
MLIFFIGFKIRIACQENRMFNIEETERARMLDTLQYIYILWCASYIVHSNASQIFIIYIYISLFNILLSVYIQLSVYPIYML